MIEASQVNIIIPHLGATKEQEYAFDQCITSLKETVPDIKILVVKNGNTPCFHHRDIRIIEQGQCKAVNAAAATISTPWLLVTNDDMVYAPGWFEELALFTDRYSCISPQLVEPRKGAPTFIEYFCGGASGDFDKQKFLDFAKNRNRTDQFNNDKLLVDRTGFNLPFLIKKELWDLISGYDVAMDPWGSNSDSDVEYKIRLAGIQPMQIAGCLVYHFSQTSGTFHPDNQSYWQKNRDYFIKKWGFPRTDEGIWEANFTIPTPPIRKFTPNWEAYYIPYRELNL